LIFEPPAVSNKIDIQPGLFINFQDIFTPYLIASKFSAKHTVRRAPYR
jgi:hypothetical protein